MRHARFWTSAVVVGLLIGAVVGFSTRAASVPPIAKPDVFVQIGEDGGHGSGVSIGNRLFVTAGHVAEAAADGKLTIVTSLGEKVPAEVLWINKSYDVAMLRATESVRVAPANLSCAAPDPETNSPIEIIGNPLNLRNIHTWGRVARSTYETGMDLPRYAMIVDITIAPGNSGGGAYSQDGRLVGIVSAMAVAQTGVMSASLIPLSYIVPSSAICTLMGRAA